jgi:hypothetical protein
MHIPSGGEVVGGDAELLCPHEPERLAKLRVSDGCQLVHALISR